MNAKNYQIRLKTRPEGNLGQDNFTAVENAVPVLRPGEALVETLLLSVDPTMRIWTTDREQYMPPVQIGEVMRAGGVGRVIESNGSPYQMGDLVTGMLGWQRYCVAKGELAVLRPAPKIPIEAYLGVLGATGATAYFGLLDIGKPQAGETLVVSAAAGAVGSIVGQIGKIKGCRVVGVAGSGAKCDWLVSDLGFDAAINYKDADFRDKLDAACPDGIDVDFENVGGEVMHAVLERMNLHGRVVLCGLIAGYNENSAATFGDFSTVLMRRLQVQGFIIIDYLNRFDEASAQLAKWVAAGKLRCRDTVLDGIQKLPEALDMLFAGGNTGKLLVRVAS